MGAIMEGGGKGGGAVLNISYSWSPALAYSTYLVLA